MITFKHEHKDLMGRISSEISLTTHEEGLSELITEFRHFLLAIGFHPESVDNYIEAE